MNLHGFCFGFFEYILPNLKINGHFKARLNYNKKKTFIL